VLAPTGTIGLMMDCDTTGIEPDLGLVKFKKLVGGGNMSIVNQTVPRALTNLGYEGPVVDRIIQYIDVNKTIVGSPDLKAEHLPVFACSMGDNTIHYEGHVRMMGAAQPFLSGAISKTVNMPEEATIEEIEALHMLSWELGIKAVAIYRDNCKVGQPLSDAKAKKTEAPVATSVAAQPIRRRMPKKRASQTVSFAVGGAEGYLTAGSYETGELGEVFLKLGKQGSTLAGVMDAFSIAISIALQFGVPLEAFVSKFTNMRFEPAGMTDDADIRMAQSIMDYIFRRLALDYLPLEKRAMLGIFTAEERAAQVSGYDTPSASTEEIAAVVVKELEDIKPVAVPVTINTENAHSSAELLEAITGKVSDAPLCFTCGIKMRPSGSCYACEGCGNTSGCS
jgi:ribonucleoside-diphosphate reductase alpha chain